MAHFVFKKHFDHTHKTYTLQQRKVEDPMFTDIKNLKWPGLFQNSDGASFDISAKKYIEEIGSADGTDSVRWDQ